MQLFAGALSRECVGVSADVLALHNITHDMTHDMTGGGFAGNHTNATSVLAPPENPDWLLEGAW